MTRPAALPVCVVAAMSVALSACGGSSGGGTGPSSSSAPSTPGALVALPGVLVSDARAKAAAASSTFVAGPERTVNTSLRSVTYAPTGQESNPKVPNAVVGWQQGQTDVAFLSCTDRKAAGTDSDILAVCLDAPITGSDAAAVRSWLTGALAQPQTAAAGTVLCGAGWAWRVSTAGNDGLVGLTVEVANPKNAQEGKCALRSP